MFLLKVLPNHKKKLKNYYLIFKIINYFFNFLFYYLKFINKFKKFLSRNYIGDKGSSGLVKGLGKLKKLKSLNLEL